MPQLDISTYLPQLFWLAVIFVAFYWVMTRVALPRVGAVLETRRMRIEQDLERAEALKKDAEAALTAYQTAMAEARATAREAILEAGQSAAAEAARRNDILTQRIAEQTAGAEARISEALAAAQAEIQSISGDLTREIAAKLTGIAPSGDAVAAAVANAAQGR